MVVRAVLPIPHRTPSWPGVAVECGKGETRSATRAPPVGAEPEPGGSLDSLGIDVTLQYKMTGKERYDADEGRRAQLLKGLGELALLKLLGDGPSYGLQILERLRAEAGIDLAEGTIYPLLHRLEKAGLTKAEWRLEGEGARPRKYYALTDAGRADLAVQLDSWRRVSSTLGTFLERTNP